MDAYSSILMIKALDGLSERQVITAQNIANANSPNYRSLRVTFEDALAKAAKSGAAALQHVEAKVEADPDAAVHPDGRLDLQLATSSATASRYAALVEILNRRLQIDAMAVGGGR